MASLMVAHNLPQGLATRGAEPAVVCYSRHGLRVAERWLDERVGRPAGCDLLLLHQFTRAPDGAFSSPFSSLALDLLQSNEVLQQGLNRKIRYEARRAEEKDHVVCVHDASVGDELCRQFLSFYDEFAESKGLGRLRESELLARARAGVLRMSRAVYLERTVAWHVHVCANRRATLLHSASHFRGLDDNELRAVVGRANRLLHWKDIVGFKADGMEVYDFGGWYAGSEDEALLKINQFKEGFGGTRTDQVNAAMALSWRGWVYLKLRDLLSPRQRKRLQLTLQAIRRR